MMIVAATLKGQVPEEPTSTAGWEGLLLPEDPANQVAIPALSKRQQNPPTNTLRGTTAKAPPAVLRGQPVRIPSGDRPRPGVYETAPYTCIVVVPGPQADDKMIVGRYRMATTNVLVPRMPMVQPELRFIPREKR